MASKTVLYSHAISNLTAYGFIGQTGLGKSTLINTIFASHLIDSKGRREADEPVRQTTEIQTVSHGIVFFFSLDVAANYDASTHWNVCSYHRERRATAP